ncbi:MAG: response regulator transcription factor [Bacteroidales bacterium]|nr:response regulator transcription factor [Bacteroidales bacterium]
MIPIEITAILVDDEPDALNYLAALLKEIPGIQVLAQEISVTKGVEAIISFHPDIVFLDIDMPKHDGFELVRQIKELNLSPTIIFTTGHPEFAIEAFDKAAFGYLLKPVTDDKLRAIINRYRCEKIIKTETHNRHKLHTFKGYVWINEHDIMGCKADGNYTDIYLTSGKNETVIAQLGKIEEILHSPSIFRAHRSALINTQYLFSFDRKTSTVKLVCRDHEVVLPVAKEKFGELEGMQS